MADFTITPLNNQEFLLNNISQFTDNVSYSLDGTNWIQISEPSIIIMISEPNNYEITLSAERCGISDTTYQTIEVLPNSVNGATETDFVVYPNPVYEMTTLEIPDSYTCIGIQVVNLLGETVMSSYTTFQRTFKIDCSSLSSGIYSIQVLTKGETLTKKIKVF